MGRDDILNEIMDIKKKLGSMDAKMDRLLKKQVALETKFEQLESLQKTINTLPAKLNTTTYQVISQMRDEIGDIENEFEERIEETMGKLEALADVNHRLDVFEENLKAYIEKMRYMLLELEDEIKERRYEDGR